MTCCIKFNRIPCSVNQKDTSCGNMTRCLFQLINVISEYSLNMSANFTHMHILHIHMHMCMNFLSWRNNHNFHKNTTTGLKIGKYFALLICLHKLNNCTYFGKIWKKTTIFVFQLGLKVSSVPLVHERVHKHLSNPPIVFNICKLLYYKNAVKFWKWVVPRLVEGNFRWSWSDLSSPDGMQF